MVGASTLTKSRTAEDSCDCAARGKEAMSKQMALVILMAIGGSRINERQPSVNSDPRKT